MNSLITKICYIILFLCFIAIITLIVLLAKCKSSSNFKLLNKTSDCNISDLNKIDCMGPSGADPSQCLSDPSCCFSQAGTPSNPKKLPGGGGKTNVPWCFKKSPQATWIVDDQKWYADYGAEQFAGDTTLVQHPSGAGGRLFLGSGPGTRNDWTPESCRWWPTGQWQIDIQINPGTEGWCESFYLAGRNKNGEPDCSTYADGQDGYTTEIAICKTETNCNGFVSNILNFGGPGKNTYSKCIPVKPGTWMTCGARIMDNAAGHMEFIRVEIYYKMETDKKLTLSNSMNIPGSQMQEMVPYLGTMCLLGGCKPPNSFTTKWKNYKYMDSNASQGPLRIIK